MINNSISNLASISIEQLIALLVVNIIGSVCLWLAIYLINKKTSSPKTKLVTSIKLGLGSIILFAVLSGNVGISLWVESGNFQAALFAIPLFICGSIFMLPVVLMGTYVQLIYQDKIQGYLDSQKR